MSERHAVVVIGGGVVGTSTLFHLTERGCTDAVLVEKGQLGSGSTSKAIGGIRNVFSHPHTVETGNRCLDFYRDFEGRVGTPLEVERTGYIYLCHTETALDEWAERKAMLDGHGVSSRLLTPAEVGERFPPLDTSDLAGAFLGRDCGHLDPHTATAGFAEAAVEAGASVRTNTPVEDLLTDGGGVTGVCTPDGEIGADRVVCAAGPWTPALAATVGVDVPVDLSARRIAVTEPIEPANSPLLIDRELRCYFRTEGSGSMLLCDIDGDITDVEDPGSVGAGNVGYDYYLQALSKVEQLVPSVADLQVTNGWAGVQAASPDGHPILGPTGVEGFSVACGFSGLGVMMAPAYGRALADHAVAGETDALDLERLTLERFADDGVDRLVPESLA